MIKEIQDLIDIDFNIELTGFDSEELDALMDISKKNPYTKKIVAPTYEPKNEKPGIDELFDVGKSSSLEKEILAAENINGHERDFLIAATKRHIVFNYSKIADYYANSNKAVQELMEKSALVIIDFDKAIENGYVELSDKIAEQYGEEYGE